VGCAFTTGLQKALELGADILVNIDADRVNLKISILGMIVVKSQFSHYLSLQEILLIAINL
jgi:hypothetical protein